MFWDFRRGNYLWTEMKEIQWIKTRENVRCEEKGMLREARGQMKVWEEDRRETALPLHPAFFLFQNVPFADFLAHALPVQTVSSHFPTLVSSE